MSRIKLFYWVVIIISIKKTQSGAVLDLPHPDNTMFSLDSKWRITYDRYVLMTETYLL